MYLHFTEDYTDTFGAFPTEYKKGQTIYKHCRASYENEFYLEHWPVREATDEEARQVGIQEILEYHRGLPENESPGYLLGEEYV